MSGFFAFFASQAFEPQKLCLVVSCIGRLFDVINVFLVLWTGSCRKRNFSR
ncbi:hypothetical protein JCM6294_2532 [Bacteroides pyogenes DSM 20611 = JCM 6294]|uniref:Uncharacterized protein n=1 Tax=Bacteroides pyogenes DSM 20611 = JCM 6294 TaxID=1121100 RepID=W4PK55_9BACE|nr:hypothetical protein JCM6294_2532 [Bacteroides pyogenes DSM 20611 = JCM 6294]